MNAYLITSSLLNLVTACILTLSGVLPGRRTRLNLSLALFALSIAVWSMAYFLWQLSVDQRMALMYCRILMLGASFVPATLLEFVGRITGRDSRWQVNCAYVAATGMAAMTLHPDYIVGVYPINASSWWPEAGPLFKYFLIYFGLVTGESWRRLYRSRLGTGGARKRQRRTILLALMIGFVGGATNFPYWYHLAIPPVGNGLVCVYLIMVGYAISVQRYSYVNTELVRGTVLVGLSMTIGVFYSLVVALVYSLAGVPIGSAGLLNSFLQAMVVVLVMIWLSPKINEFAERLAERTSFGSARRKSSELIVLAKQIGTISNEMKMLKATVDFVVDELQVKVAALFLRGELERDFELRAENGWQGLNRLPTDSALPAFLTKQQETLVAEEWQDAPQMGKVMEVCEQMDAELVVPLLIEGRVSGFLVVGSHAGDRGLDTREIQLLEALCLQVALGIRSRQMERRANQAEKLISLGTLAAGLAHELRNPLVSIRTFGELLPEQGDDPDFRNEFQKVMERDVGRITAIVDNVSAFASNAEVRMVALDLANLVQSAAEILKPDLLEQEVELELQIQAPVIVMGSYTQLLQVLINLVQNALQAIDQQAGARVIVSLNESSSEDGSGSAMITVEDNGPGIPVDLATLIFEPFVTSKSTGDRSRRGGMGLGLAIVKRIIEGHQGSIMVDTGVTTGARFTIRLPLAD